MSTLTHPGGSRPATHGLWLWAPLALGLAALLLPTYELLHRTLWNEEAYEHGMIVAVLFWWLVWRHRERLQALPLAPSPLAGGLTLALGLLLYFVGRTQNLPLFEVSAHLPLLAGTALLLWGPPALRLLWFPLLFLLFVVPLPGFVIVAVTAQLKQHVSVLAEVILYHAGYDIARDGVVISVGPYRMLVADACSGLNSLYSLTALGLLYMHLTWKAGIVRNTLLVLAIVPIAIVANVLRVMVLILLTFHFGDEVGQGFLHGVSGVLLFVVGLLCLLALDGTLRRVGAQMGSKPGSETSPSRSPT